MVETTTRASEIFMPTAEGEAPAPQVALHRPIE